MSACSAHSEDRRSRKKAKIVLVGTNLVGKLSLVESYTKGEYYENINNRIWEHYTIEKEIDEELYSLSLYVPSGIEDYDRLRPLGYPNTTCVLLCYSINTKYSYEDIKEKWAPEIKHHIPHVPFILLGMQNDWREVDDPKLDLVSVEDGKKLAKKIGAKCYLECSAKNFSSFDEILVVAVRAGKKNAKKITKKKQNCVFV